MPIPQWPADDRPREKLLLKGSSALSDAELIALIMHTGTKGKNVLELAKELLTQYGSLQNFFTRSLDEITKTSGLGIAKYARLRAALELGKRFQQENFAPGKLFNSSTAARQFISGNLKQYGNEVFACLFLNSQTRLLAYEEMFHGTVNEAAVYPREIVKRGLYHNAAKIVLGHNHPSGEAKPSPEDIQITRLIQKSLQLVDIVVVDHIIVGRNANFSFADHGLI